MGKGGSQKTEVTEYYASQHLGVCVGPVDAIRRVIIKEKLAWSGFETTKTQFAIHNDGLFGDSKKEGGVRGVAHFLPGDDAQILYDALAVKLGRSSGADAPGYRGIASVFFTGYLGFSGLDPTSNGTPRKGFYWSANSPYLPPVWITVRRAPVGLDPGLALIPRPGSTLDDATTVTTVNLDALVNVATTVAGGPAVGIVVPGFAPSDLVRLSLPFGETFSAWSAWGRANWTPGFDYFASPTGSGSITAFVILPDGDTGAAIDINPIVTPGGPTFDGFEAARAAFVPQIVTGASSYTFFIKDPFPTDNVGGLSILVETVAYGDVDANPAHIIYECLTNTDWGMGSPSTALDVDSFDEAAQTLFDEGFGLSMMWTRQAQIQEFVQEVLDHIQAVLFVDPANGLLTLKLIRGDYDVETLPEINPDNATLSNFKRKLWGEIVNEIVVTWTNPDNEQDETVTIQDLASIATQGGIISDGRNYYGVRYAALASTLAQRDLRSSGSPLVSCEAEVDRTLWEIRPASVCALVWPEYALDGVVMRVTSVDYGKPGDSTIKLTLIEDVFGLDVGTYDEPPSSSWVDPTQPPSPLQIEQVFTLPLFMAAASAVAAFVDDPAYPEVVAGVLGTTSLEDAYAFDLWNEVTLSNGSLEWQSLGEKNVIGHGELVAALLAEASSADVEFANMIGETEPVISGFVIIGDEGEEGNEIALVEAVGADYTLTRGVLDTVPRAWPAGTPVWFVDDDTLLEDPNVRSSGETVGYKFLTKTSGGTLALADAALVSYELTDRPWMPNRPANVTAYAMDFNTEDTPVDAIGRADPWITVTWANRNRLLEDSQVLGWSDADMTPETGQTTTIEVLTSDGLTVLDTHSALTGTTFDVPDSSFGGETTVMIRVSSERADADGTFPSLQAHAIWVQVASGSRATEEGDDRLTEEGDTRGLED